MTEITQPTAEYRLIAQQANRHTERGRLETGALVSGAVLAGALVVALIWWWTDPQMPRANTANLIFMAITSGAVVSLFYAMVRSGVRTAIRGEVQRVLYAVETQGQSHRAQLRDVQWEVAGARMEGRRQRQALAMQIHDARPVKPRRPGEQLADEFASWMREQEPGEG